MVRLTHKEAEDLYVLISCALDAYDEDGSQLSKSDFPVDTARELQKKLLERDAEYTTQEVVTFVYLIGFVIPEMRRTDPGRAKRLEGILRKIYMAAKDAAV